MTGETDICVVNARVITMDGDSTVAGAFAFSGGRIIAVGTDQEVLATAGERTRVIDVGGAAVVPGLIDAHSHLEMLAYAWEVAVDVRSTRVGSVREIVAVLAEAARDVPEGEWILGQGEHYQHLKLAEGVYPDRHDLDRVSTRHPVIYRASYHINVFNSLALDMLGVDDDTPDAPGGRIERDPETGVATGRTYDMFAPLNGPQAPVGVLAAAMRKTEERYSAVGVTAVGDIQLHTHALDALIENAESTELRLRAVAYPKLPTVLSDADVRSGTLKERFSGIDRERLSLGGIKIFLDGGLTAGAAALHEDYPERPGYRGELAYTDEEVCRLVALADENGLQIAMHAIGDRALDQAIAAVEALPAHRRGVIRHRIEHAGNMFMTAERIKRMAEAAIVPVPQPAFLLTTATGYLAHLGAERIGTVMPFRTLIDSSLPVPGNSDAIGITADQHNPFPAMQAAVERRASGGELLDEREAVTAHEALRMYTTWAAHSIGLDDIIGSLEVGKAADFVVLSDDPTAVAVEDIGRIHVTATWVDGKEVHAPKPYGLPA
ncbi:amidohydrolase [Sphaerisporangium sp. NPDC051011]|uniref:amidohydrolase n=1 Tax=Sphaerisporangium sp. NPDC051011 TaxID=3155792 RepID=UPI0033D2FCAF